MNIKDELMTEAEKHKGTKLGGFLQMVAFHIESQSELIAELESDNKGLFDDCKKMHEGLIKIDALTTELSGLSFGAMPISAYAASASKDISSHANIMNYHGVEGYGKKGKPTPHKDTRMKTVIV
jgi:hypothetical protein